MSHIVIDARELRTSSGRYVERLLHYLQEVDKLNHYTILIKPSDIDGWDVSSPNFTKLACPHKEFSFAEQIAFKKQLDSLDADLVHFPFVQQPIRYKGRVVTTIQDLTTLGFDNPAKNPIVFKFKQQIYKHVIKRATSKSLELITPSEFVKNDVVQFTGVEPDKITVTYESADKITDPATPIGSLVGEQFLMYIGRPTPHKNLDRLIEAFISLRASHPRLKLVLAGKKDANYKRIEESITKRGVKDVVFTDFVSEGQLRWLYENCATYVFPSLSEGFGLPALEAMIHGAPLASSSATCLPEICGDAAHYFDPLNIQSMVDSINEILTDDDLRTALINKGYSQVAKYSWQHMAEQTLNVYKKALFR